MRTPVLLVTLALLALPMTVLVPGADAFGWCTSMGPGAHRCENYIVCIGWGYDSLGEHCQYGVPQRDWCEWLCTNGPPIP